MKKMKESRQTDQDHCLFLLGVLTTFSDDAVARVTLSLLSWRPSVALQ